MDSPTVARRSPYTYNKSQPPLQVTTGWHSHVSGMSPVSEGKKEIHEIYVKVRT
jgi:hypothetical protein